MRLKEKIQFKINQFLLTSLSVVEQGIHGLSLNVLSKDLIADPYPYYNRVRNKAPLYYSMAIRAWWVTSFDLVQEVLVDKRFGVDVRRYEKRWKKILANLDEERRERFDNPSMLGLDPPDHSRIRRLASKGFLHKYIQSLEPRIRDIVDFCLQRVDNGPIFDIVESLAKPLPAIVIAEMMGLPASDHEQFQAWSEDLIVATSTRETEKIEKGQLAARQLINYFRKIIKERRGNPGSDLIGQLILAEDAGDKLTEMELYNTCNLLLVAGHETTTRLIGNGVYLLLQSPDLWAQLREDRSKIPNAVEEMLRFEPPVQATQRFVTQDMEFHGKKLKRGDIVLIGIAAGNRDPNNTENPDVFDINREKVSQVSFGYGIHLCIGASLARMEARVAFETLLEKFPHMALVDENPRWGDNAFFRGHEKLDVYKEAAR